MSVPANNATFSRGDPFEQIFHVYPSAAVLYPFAAENNFHPEALLDAMKADNYSIPAAAVTLYLLFCYFGQRYMKSA